jgi:hypothetical protein
VSVVEIRKLARVVIDAGGNLDDLKRLVALWEAGGRTVADLSDGELLATFPGSSLEDGSPVAPCGCRRRSREWRLRAPAFDVTWRYVSRAAFHEATARPLTDRRGVVAVGPESGWVWEAAPSDLPHAWQCRLCHPPVDGLEIETREEATFE